MRVALAQIDLSPTDLEANIANHIEVVKQTIENDVDLVVFPELSLAGDSTKGSPQNMMLALDDNRMNQLYKLSQDIDIVCGLIEARDDFNYNSAIYLSDGEIKHIHRKVFLATYATFFEDEFCKPGSSIKAFDTAIARTSILICNDIWHPLLPYISALHGTELMIVPTNSARNAMGEQLRIKGTWESLNLAYAGSLGVFVLFVNRAGKRYVEDTERIYWGGSEIIAPNGERIAKAAYDKSDILIADIDISQANIQQQDAHIFRDLDAQVMLSEFSRAIKASEERYGR